MHEPLESSYFDWLCAKVVSVEVPTPSLTYYRLLRTLQNTEFIYLFSGDDNRAADGVDLRHSYLHAASINDPDPGWLEIPSSILEMLVAFARICEFETEESVVYWFWTFVENLGLSPYNDAHNWADEDVTAILETFVWRLYDADGRGSLFPLNHPPHDMRNVEIWYQFCEYLVDRD